MAKVKSNPAKGMETKKEEAKEAKAEKMAKGGMKMTPKYGKGGKKM